MHSPWAGGVILVAFAVLALILANIPQTAGVYHHLLESHLTVGFDHFRLSKPLEAWINDGLMVIFFFYVGLEIKREIIAGQLSGVRRAALPVAAAIGGMAVPALIYVLINRSGDFLSGWGIPMATDIAFAIGILSLLGNRVPVSLKVFLMALAVVDDLGGILVIAVFYSTDIQVGMLVAAAVVFVFMILLKRLNVYKMRYYLILSVVMWILFLYSGIHATIAGVLLAFTIPTGSRVNLHSFMDWSGEQVHRAREAFEPETPVLAQEEYLQTVKSLSRVSRQVVPPAIRLEHRLHPWVYFAALPLFALTNAGVRFIDGDPAAIFADPVLYGVMLGLLIGKPIGIMLMSFLTVKLKAATLPQGVTWLHMLGAGILGGVGFTMAIFVANLAYADPAHIATAKMGILLASLAAGAIGFLFLLVQAKRSQGEKE